MRSCLLPIAALCLAMSAATSARAESGRVTFVVAKGFAEGFFAPSLQVLEKSGLQHDVDMDVPGARIFDDLKAGQPMCLVGGFWNQERTQFANYSLAAQQDRPEVVFVNKTKHAEISKHKTYKALLADETIIASVPAPGISNGAYLDGLYAGRKNNIEVVPLGALDARVKKLLLGRLDWIRVRANEVEEVQQIAKQEGGELAVLALEDEPPGGKRHFMCAKTLPDTVVNTLNETIKKLYPDLNN